MHRSADFHRPQSHRRQEPDSGRATDLLPAVALAVGPAVVMLVIFLLA
jgi:hypothetical protein